VVAAGPRRVEELAAAERGPTVDPDADRRRRLASGKQLVGELGEGGPKRGPVAPHVELAGKALDYVDGRVAAFGL
jgi:hypothetical protein